MLQLNASKTWLQFEKLSQENNKGLLKIWIGRSPIIVCNDAWSASEVGALCAYPKGCKAMLTNVAF
jgi:hypothetical protein